MKNAVILIIILACYISCYGQKKSYSYSEYIYKNIVFTEITITLDRKTGDTLQIEGTLKSKTIIEEIPCCGNITLTKICTPKKFILAEDHVFGGCIFPAGTAIETGIDLHNSSDINTLDNYFAIREAGKQYLNECKFPFDMLINGLKCDGEKGVFFTTDWTLIGCILAEDDTVAGNLMPASTFIRFNCDSTICCFCLVDPEIQGYQCSGTNYYGGMWMGGGGIFLYPSGRLKHFQPVDTVKIQGVLIKPSSVRGGINLYENGKLKSCTSAEDQTINGVFCGKNYRVKLDKHENIIYAKKEKIFD